MQVYTHSCKPQVCHIQTHQIQQPLHAGETLLLADSIGAYCDTEYEFLSADTKTNMCLTAAMIISLILWIYRVALAQSVFWWLGVSTTVQLAGGKDTLDTTYTKFKTGGCRAPTDYRACRSSYQNTREAPCFFFTEERNDRRLSTPARARGYSRREHITRGNTYPRVGGTHITVIHQGEQISPGAWPGICVRGNRKSQGTHISATPPPNYRNLTNFVGHTKLHC